MKRKELRIRRIAACMAMVWVMAGVTGAAFATGPVNLEDIGKTTAVAETAPVETPMAAEQEQATTSEVKKNMADAGSFTETMKEATKMDTNTTEIAAITSPVAKIAGIVVQCLGVITTVGLVIRVALDMVYIFLPFTQTFLANGRAGTPAGGQPANGMNPGMGGFGTPGMGGYGMGGYGMNRGYGMGSMGMGGMGMGGMGMNAMGAQNQQQTAIGRIQWVSNAALNAVASEGVPGPNGKPASAISIYAKDMVVVLVAVPVMLALLWSGVLQNIGFALGAAIVRGLGSVSF